MFNEENFIKQLSIDCVIFGYKDKELKVLVSKLLMMNDVWALPGGFIYQNESTDEAANRILRERTGLENIYLEQFRVFGSANRINHNLQEILLSGDFEKMNPINFNTSAVQWLTQRFVSIGYYALVDIDKVNPQKTEFDESVSWYSIDELPQMIIDHNEMVVFALETLRQNLDRKLIGFNLLPEIFTIKEVQELYEAVYDNPFARNNFQKKILDLNVLERLEKKFTGAANKAPYLYRFRK
jgi:8-oxo-dGTP diphosphatase